MSKLRELRLAKNLSLSGLAKIMKVSKTTMSKIENGHRRPSIGLAFKLAKFFDVSVEELFPELMEEVKV